MCAAALRPKNTTIGGNGDFVSVHAADLAAAVFAVRAAEEKLEPNLKFL